jgi:hypothetical protein
MDIVKAGWLQRRTTILKNWKREWFVLTRDALLRRMSSPVKQNAKADDVFQLNRWREIRIGSEQVSNTIEPPNGSTREQLMELVPSKGDIWILCAESTDDLLAWQTAFDDVRQFYIEYMQQQDAQWTNAQIPPRRRNFTDYQRFYYADYPCRIYQAPDGSTHTIVFVDRNSFYDTRDDIAVGTMTGGALGILMFWPSIIVPFYPLMWF